MAPLRLPPGPAAGRLAQTVAFARDPLGALRRAQARYGRVFTLRFVPSGPVVVVALPDEVERLTRSDGEGSRAGAPRRAVLTMASPQSSFGGDGPQHRAARGRVAPAIAPERIARHAPEIVALAERHAAGWPDRRPFHLLPKAKDLADEAFTRIVLGVGDDAQVALIVAGIRRMLASGGNPPVPPPGPGDGLLGAAGKRLFDRRKAPLEEALAAAIDARRASGPRGDDDLIDCMLADGLSTPAVIDELLAVLMAAQEPMGIALTSAVLELGRAGVVDRYATAADEDPWKDAALKEVLRLRPAGMASLRELTEPARVDGHELPAGASLMVPIVLLHRDPAVFEDPDAFRPERFLDGVPPAAYFPFGGGVRSCVGQPLADALLRAGLPAALRRRPLAPVWPREERMVQRATVLPPAHGGWVRAV